MRGVATCVESLLNAGICCEPGCDRPAVVAVICRPDPADEFADPIEHARCLHCPALAREAARKPFRLSPEWRS